jgi:monovalent cation:H+ antiporter-2, CPA2 family
MQQYVIIKEIVIILLVSIPIIFLFKKINIPSILGFLVTGIIIGPYGFKLISNLHDIEVMAEIGVILLLFTIGLEVSLGKLLRMKKILFLIGCIQIILTILITSAIFYLLKAPLSNSIFYGMLVSLSSTAIVLKLLSDKNEIDAPHGRISLVILILQDLAIVPMLILLPILSGGNNMSAVQIFFQLIYALCLIAIIVLIAKVLMPKILFQLARLRIREAFTIGVIFLLLGTAYLTHFIGLSFAIGAFIAGLILSESDFSHQITSEIIPLKDAFNSIFFVSIGLLLNIQFVLNNILLLVSVSLAIIILKTSIVTLLVKVIKYPFRTALITGFGISQIGEFSFVLSQAGLKYNLIGNDFYNAFLAASIFTMLASPLLLKLAPAIGFKVNGVIKAEDSEKEELTNHVIIVGYGLNGRNLSRVLKETGIDFVIIEMNPETVKAEKLKGKKLIFGDVAREGILQAAGIERASIIVFAISDPSASKRGLQLAKRLNPKIHTVIRTRFTSEINGLIALGADEVIPEEFETSLRIFTKVLEKYHIPRNVINEQVTLLRGESYGMMRSENALGSPFVNLNKILAAGLTETFYVSEDSSLSDKTLHEINLRALTGTTVIAIVRENQTINNPGGNEKIRYKDTLVLTGTHKSVDEAINFLSGNKII